MAGNLTTDFKNPEGATKPSAPVAIVNQTGNAGSVTITRPSNATPYTAGDMIGKADTGVPANAGDAVLKFTDLGNPGGVLKITAADLLVHLGAVPAGMGSFTMHLYDAVPDAKLDNAPWAFSSVGDRAKYLGSIVIGAPALLGSTLFVENSALAKCVKLAAGSSDLYGVLVSAGGYTPTSGEVYKVRLHVQNCS
jgi:hypothetical protein